MQRKANEDVAVIDRLRRERDELRQIKEGLRSECDAAREEHDRAI